MRWLSIFLSRGIPAYFWLGIAYAIYVGLMAAGGVVGVGGDAVTTPGAEPEPFYMAVEASLGASLFEIPLFSGNSFAVTWTVIFITLGFLCSWVEVVRATAIRDTARNDTASLIVTLVAFVLFVGVSSFGTTAFLIVALVGFGDVLLDRYVGQAVARRDFGGMFGGDGHT